MSGDGISLSASLTYVSDLALKCREPPGKILLVFPSPARSRKK